MNKYAEKLIAEYPHRFVFLSYLPNLGGNLVSRIIKEDEKFFSHGKMLEWPELTEGFGYWKTTLDYKSQQLACIHADTKCNINFTNFTSGNAQYGKTFFQVLDIIKNTDKQVVVMGHPIKGSQSDIYYFKNVKVITIVGSLKRFEIGKIENWTAPFGFKLNINKLTSENFDTFLEEYIKLITYLDLTPRVNPVRSFILLWNEKQKRLQKLLS